MHQETHLESSETIKDIVIGMADGLTVPFALAAGLSGAVDNTSLVITAGIAEIAAGSIAMGLGGYLAGKTDINHYYSELKREYYEVDEFPEKEKAEVREILEEYGLSEVSQNIVVEEMAKDKDKWVNFMMRFELGLEKPHPNRARNSAIVIGISYIVGGLIPLSSYFFAPTVHEGFMWSCIVTTICLFIFGALKSKATGQPVLMGALKVTMIGIVAAAAAYFIAKAIME